MSKKSKSVRKEKRKAAKSQKKAAKAALYRSYAEQGRKNRLSRAGGYQTPGGHKGQHLVADCGNPGCIRCHPMLNNYVLCNGKTRLEHKAELAAKVPLRQAA